MEHCCGNLSSVTEHLQSQPAGLGLIAGNCFFIFSSLLCDVCK